MTADPTGGGFYSYAELLERGDVRSRMDMKRKQEESGFPRSVKLGKRQVGFAKRLVHAWEEARLEAAMQTAAEVEAAAGKEAATMRAAEMRFVRMRARAKSRRTAERRAAQMEAAEQVRRPLSNTGSWPQSRPRPNDEQTRRNEKRSAARGNRPGSKYVN